MHIIEGKRVSLKDQANKIAGSCLAVRVRMLNRTISGIYDDALRPYGLKVSQMNILVAAATMELARPIQLCQALQIDVSTLSRNVDRMKNNGWLEVVPEDDKRAQPFRLTKAGSALLQEVIPAWEDAQKQAKKAIGPRGVQWLLSDEE
ncbi:MAG: DNA-binding MarR family transcriptional regulator [Pirellulaceae bacterium]|jgi:DNA-binding MarR family transcriptional regulator